MKIKVITSYKPGCWNEYAKKGIESMAKHFPAEIDLVVYAEEPRPECNYDRIKWIDLNTAEPELTAFKQRHKDDPVAHGKLQTKVNGVRRVPELQTLGGSDKNKESFQFHLNAKHLKKFNSNVKNLVAIKTVRQFSSTKELT